jgi:hypothetical protein
MYRLMFSESQKSKEIKRLIEMSDEEFEQEKVVNELEEFIMR